MSLHLFFFLSVLVTDKYLLFTFVLCMLFPRNSWTNMQVSEEQIFAACSALNTHAPWPLKGSHHCSPPSITYWKKKKTPEGKKSVVESWTNLTWWTAAFFSFFISCCCCLALHLWAHRAVLNLNPKALSRDFLFEVLTTCLGDQSDGSLKQHRMSN